jgi:isopentenyl diphosphate isomerase/L-lactate dehydrogenase-like FMN-dependent dehydrogenase
VSRRVSPITLVTYTDVRAGDHERAPVLLDSGIRSGADVFTAVSLGATAVLLGRPFAWRLRSPESKACGR